MRYQSKPEIKWGVWRRIKAYALTGFILFLGISFSAFLIYFPLFKVRAVNVAGEYSTPETYVTSAVASQLMAYSSFNRVLGLSNILVWGGSKKTIDGALKGLPTIGSLKISRNFFNGHVTIKTSDRQKEILWCVTSSGLCYFTDASGIVFLQAGNMLSSAPSSTVPVMLDSYDSSLTMLKSVLSESDYSNLLKVISLIENLGYKTPTLYLKNLNYEGVAFKTPDNKEMYFSLLSDPSADLDAMKNIINSGEWSGIHYIDLRVRGRVYYK